MAVITTVPTPMDPIRVVAVPGTVWIPVDTSVKVLHRLEWPKLMCSDTKKVCYFMGLTFAVQQKTIKIGLFKISR